ncbi:uncharacterized protein LOC128922610 isoform X2 [Zeugodacus cucurbitae]|uniref:uncharacterized protein LOC128922610 isoform X2 n=1 Tax=Zeugodacus cucurbitae TaxID=28588 RepID=UPI0023D916FE|nr:uncharacterized protein LOC128922610 isoform X2 [Zeugodacus cucurbitae]
MSAYIQIIWRSELARVSGKMDFTNIKCDAMDKTYNSIKYCYIRSVNRTFKYLSAANHFHSKEPITNISVGVAVLKRANGYKPFLYNVTVDSCKFLRTGGNPLLRFLHSLFHKYSNINHTCPYNHDIEVNVLPVSHIDNLLTNVLPFPKGDYQLVTSWYAYNVLRAVVRIFGTLS